MRIVVSLDGHDLAQDGRLLGSDLQRASIKAAAQALAPVAFQHQLLVICNSGPNEHSAGHMLELELSNQLPFDVPFATILPVVEIEPHEATPQRLLESQPIRWLLERGTVVICPASRAVARGDEDVCILAPVDAVMDQDRVSQVLARDVEADLLVLVRDVDGVGLNRSTSYPRKAGWVTPDDLMNDGIAAGSANHAIEAAIWFVEQTGARIAIGPLQDVLNIVIGEAGLNMVKAVPANFKGLLSTRKRKDEPRWNNSVCIPRLEICAKLSSTGPNSASSG